MRILAVDHNALNPLHRSLYGMLSEYDDVDLRVVVPDKWFDNYRLRHWMECENVEGNDVHRSKVLFPTRTHRLIYLGLRKELKSFQPDMLYMNAEPENLQTLQAALLHRKEGRGRFVFSSWRNIDHADVGFPYKLGFLNTVSEQYVLKHADHCIAFSESAARIYRKLGFTHVTVIPPSVDTTLFKPSRERREKTRTEAAPHRIGYLGRFVETKGVDVLLKAVAKLSLNCSVTLVGDGPAKGKWLSLARELELGDCVKIVGPVEPETIPTQLHGMDVVVLPSRTSKHWKEQFGRILIEAMACGVPVIGSTSGEIPSVIGNAGLVFKENDEEALALGLQKILLNEQLQDELFRRGLDRVRKKYSHSAVVPLYHTLFKSMTETPQAVDP